MRILKVILAAFVVLAFSGILLCLSYSVSRRASDDLVAPIQSSNHYTFKGGHFNLLQAITFHWGPSWVFFYDPNDFGIGYLAIQTTLAGKVFASNPRNALEELKRLKSQQLKKAAEQGAAANP